MGTQLTVYKIPEELGCHEGVVFIVQTRNKMFPNRDFGGMYVVRPRGMGTRLKKKNPWGFRVMKKMDFSVKRWYFTKKNWTMGRKILYVDMDNVLVDFPCGIRQLSDKKKEEYENRLDEIPDFFNDLPPIEGSIEGFYQLQQKYEIYILSMGPWNNPSAWSDKLLGVKKTPAGSGL